MKIKIERVAKSDLSKAFIYYQQEANLELAERFKEAFTNAIMTLRQNPKAGRKLKLKIVSLWV